MDIRKELSYAKADAEYELGRNAENIIIDFNRYKKLVEFAKIEQNNQEIESVYEFMNLKINVSIYKDVLKFE